MRPLSPLVEKFLVPGRKGQTLLIALACTIFVWYSQKAYFADSEIFSLTIARTKQALDIGQAYKLLFSLVLKATVWFDLKEEQPLLFARFIFAIIGVFNLLLAASLYKLVFRRPHLEVTPILFILGFTVFFERGFRIRADNLSATWHLLILWYFMRYWYYRVDFKNSGSLHIVALTLMEILMILTSVKAGMVLLALHVFYFTSIKGLGSERYQQVKRALFWKIRNQVDLVLLVMVFIFYFDASFDLLDILFGSTTYLVEATHASAGMPDYLSRVSFYHVTKFLQENPFSALLMYLPLVFVVSRSLRRFLSRQSWADRVSSFYLYCFVVTLFFVLFPEKYPFFLASLLPVLSLPAVRFGSLLLFLTTRFLRRWQWTRRQRYALARILFIVCSIGSVIIGAQTVISRSSNAGQIHFIKNMTKFLNQFGRVKYYDVIGTLPDHDPLIAFAGPNQDEENRQAFFRVMAELPPFIFYTRKITFLEPHINSLLSRRYLNLGQGVFARGVRHIPNEMEKREWMGETFWAVPLNDINDSLGELEVPFKDIETFVEPNEIEPLVDKVPIYFYMIEATGAVFPLHEVWLEDESGWITLYDEIQPWKYVRGKYKYLLIPKTGKNIGISIYPPIGFQAKDSLLFLFAFDVEF